MVKTEFVDHRQIIVRLLILLLPLLSVVLRDFVAKGHALGFMPSVASAGAAVCHPNEKDAKDEDECAQREAADEFGLEILRPDKRGHDASHGRQHKENASNHPTLDPPTQKPAFRDCLLAGRVEDPVYAVRVHQ